MNESATGFRLDDSGNCNYCTEFLARWDTVKANAGARAKRLDLFLDKVRTSGRDLEYDCIVGVSGGVDSSYALYLAVKNGLRPLAVHLDNGWNSEIATNNISNLLSHLEIDLYTHVIDWEENRDLQLAFMKANVIDIELLMDNAMLALNYEQAARHGLKYILAGTNTATEGMRMPQGWNHYKFDVKNIKNIATTFGVSSWDTHPLLSTAGVLRYSLLNDINWIAFLDYFNYSKGSALETLQRECGYKTYPYKHYESVFTRFYQGYILPRKFGVDKRRLHLSNLILTGEMSRDAAIASLEDDPYPDRHQQEKDRTFVIKKLGVTEEWFEAYMLEPRVPHGSYGLENPVFALAARAARRLKRA